jgi:hypothetical protein
MIRLEIASAPPARNPREQIDVAKYVDALVADPRFGELMSRTADECVHEWSLARTTEERERLWFTLQGVHRLMRSIQKEIEYGISAAAEVERTESRPPLR